MQEIIGIIPARGGSKRVPGKNIRPLAGKPLIAHTINQSKRSGWITRTIVSTEDETTAAVAREYGAGVMQRPLALASDTARSEDVVLDVADRLLEEGHPPDILVLLQPTSPCRGPEDIDLAIQAFRVSGGDSLISITPMVHHPFWSLRIRNGYLQPLITRDQFDTPRHELPEVYYPNGAIYIITPDTLREQGTFFTKRSVPYLMPPERSVDIDTELDFLIAEQMLKAPAHIPGVS